MVVVLLMMIMMMNDDGDKDDAAGERGGRPAKPRKPGWWLVDCNEYITFHCYRHSLHSLVFSIFCKASQSVCASNRLRHAAQEARRDQHTSAVEAEGCGEGNMRRQR